MDAQFSPIETKRRSSGIRGTSSHPSPRVDSHGSQSRATQVDRATPPGKKSTGAAPCKIDTAHHASHKPYTWLDRSIFQNLGACVKKKQLVSRSPKVEVLPKGLASKATLKGHANWIARLAWSADGQFLASPSRDGSARVWNVDESKCIAEIHLPNRELYAAAFHPSRKLLAMCGTGKSLDLWDYVNNELIAAKIEHGATVNDVVFTASGHLLSAGADGFARLWNISNGQCIHSFSTNGENIYKLDVDEEQGTLIAATGNGRITSWDLNTGTTRDSWLAHTTTHSNVCVHINTKLDQIATSGGLDPTIRIWTRKNHQPIRSLEGHSGWVAGISISADGELMASKGDHDIRLWNARTGECVAILPDPASGFIFSNIAFCPTGSKLAIVCQDHASRRNSPDVCVSVLDVDLKVLLSSASNISIAYTSAKIVLVGDSGVGKTGLGWRLAHGDFKEHSSTHGQQFWVLKELSQQRADGTQCEAVLWDLAGQPDYRLIHALFIDDADLALIVFDPTRDNDPLSGVEYWLKQLGIGTRSERAIPAVLVAARCDRGTPRLTAEDLSAYCTAQGLATHLATSAKEGDGVEPLVSTMHTLIEWDKRPATVTTETFKRIKDLVLDLKENRRRKKMIVTIPDLKKRLKKGMFKEEDIATAVGHLSNHGYVALLKTSHGESMVLLSPELLNNVAASLILEARRNQRGLGALEEDRLLSGGYTLPEFTELSEPERVVLLDSAVALFLKHNVCFRETDPHNSQTYLVFPELINLRQIGEVNHKEVEDGVAYTIRGPVENLYASLVVLMGYTQTFTRTNQWQNHARYEVGGGQVCGFRLEEERADGLDFVLYFSNDTASPTRMLFQGLFESFLSRRDVAVLRIDPVACVHGHRLLRAVVRAKVATGTRITFCNECGARIELGSAGAPIALSAPQQEEVQLNRQVAHIRSRFEQLLFRLRSYVTEQKLVAPSCFISYAWGDPIQERWIERSLATDLKKSGVLVILDRWENSRIGASVPRFVERISSCSHVVVVGTTAYRRKYDNQEPMRGFVLAAEGDLIGKRMIGTNDEKESVLPVLLEGTDRASFPALLQGRVYSDFRSEEKYFEGMLSLLTSIYRIPVDAPICIDLRAILENGPGQHVLPVT